MSGSLGKSKSGQSSRSTQDVWDPQKPYLQDVMGSAQDLYGQDAGRYGTQMQEQYAGSQGLQDIIGGAQQAWQSNLTPQENPYLQRAMQSAMRPITQNYQENVLSGITDQAVQAGQSGSSRQGIREGIADREYIHELGDVANRMAYGDYSAGMDRQGRAIDQAAGVANLGMMPSGIMRDAGLEDWRNLERYKGVIGAPTTLSESSGSGFGRSFQTSGGMGG